MIPSIIRDQFDDIENEEAFIRLVEAIASWYSSMELCQDLLDRIQLYGISAYLDEQAITDELEKNWKVGTKGINIGVDRAQSYFSKAASTLFDQISMLLGHVGVLAAAQSTVTKYVWGYACVHPGYFVSAILSSALLKIGAENLREQSVLNHLDLAAKDFSVVASNLRN